MGMTGNGNSRSPLVGASNNEIGTSEKRVGTKGETQVAAASVTSSPAKTETSEETKQNESEELVEIQGETQVCVASIISSAQTETSGETELSEIEPKSIGSRSSGGNTIIGETCSSRDGENDYT